ncbi:MAG: HD domain-containing protein [Brevinematales bacterium]|nr:HD domain-containing protein [Brevinematales bacterium]
MRTSKSKLAELLAITEKLNHVKDLDSLLDNILYEARKFTSADAGTIFLVEGEKLKFSYFQNDTLDKKNPTINQFIYSIFEIPIDEKSIAGYVALTGKPLIINDVYQITDNVPYSFNPYFDNIFDYRTVSTLTIPLITSRQNVVGVMQIINAMDENGNITPFDDDDKMFVTFFANNASVAIERAKMTREMVLRMIKMAELRDPKETGNHVNRVAAYTIEIYERLAKKKNVPVNEIKKTKDALRIAAMLHDVGKVAISDTILKKKGKLSDEEFKIMKLHTVYGARLFENSMSEMDMISKEIALNHHEKWDGSGYPGYISDIFSNNINFGRSKKGEEIPLFARIVALADVYDALISERVYKSQWDEEETKNYILSQRGKHFDPDIVDAFFEIYDVIVAIRKKYSD